MVHGDIRHLENHPEYLDQPILSSWRHTPFRNDPHADFLLVPVNMTTAERMKKGNYGAKADETKTASA